MKNFVFLVQKIRSLFEKRVSSKSKSEDIQRREFILNVLLLSLIAFLIIANGIVVVQSIVLENYRGISPFLTGIVFSCFTFLYFLSRKGFLRLSSYSLLIAFFLPVTYQIYMWGAEMPTALLSYVVIIFVAGILINKHFTFIATAIISATLAASGYFQIYGVIHPNLYWKAERVTIPDIIIFVAMLFIIATVSWLSNREIEKSLARARRSETELKKERDSLEITVEARTRELKETQAEKMTQLYRFAEFGRLSSGFFHDLINPLTAVSLNIEKIKNTEVSEYVNRAIVAAKKMEDMVSAVRKQLSRQEAKILFSVNDEIAQALEVLAYKAQKSGVAIRLFSREEIKTYGDAIKFNQVALNLVANAIDAYLEKTNIDSKPITMSLSKEGGMIVFEVKDKGVGIPEENKPKLFEPFFTTRKEGCGFGIGLSMTKRIIEKDFDGSIEVASKEGEGSVFTVKFPQKDNA